ncbi:glycosyltransferase family protein [Marispirochaeta aestuarii]|uniref:glycosyltransferase family protein n=1 Tax=Marispirochaeta aestuarii TaxID=1963862 RepID=UPI0029C6AB85|nr:glycosyltransferase family protein [Marispirochaeta aestuarii]
MIIALIQARMGSTRLPGKVLKPLDGKAVIEHVIERTKKATGIDEVIVVTSIESANLPLIRHVASLGIRVFVGSEDDVLDRYWQAARLTPANHIVRVTADCPLLDSTVVASVIKVHLEQNNDYTSNIDPPTWPDGLDVEVMKRSVLEIAWREAEDSHDREHVTPYIRRNYKRFRLGNVLSQENLSEYRWTLDREEDYRFLCRIFRDLSDGTDIYFTHRIIDYLKKNPELLSINQGIMRNEGSMKRGADNNDI